MKVTKWICDRCGEEIDGVVYSLTCNAFDAVENPMGGVSTETATQNIKQSFSRTEEAHLCRECKDAITDGVFIV